MKKLFLVARTTCCPGARSAQEVTFVIRSAPVTSCASTEVSVEAPGQQVVRATLRTSLSIMYASVFVLLSMLALHAQDATPSPAPAASDDNDAAAHRGFSPERYQDLWTKSPFAVETPDAPVTDSAEYSFVGVAQLGDVTYVSLVQKQNQAHLLVSSDKPLGDLKLDSISNKGDGVYASFTQNGQPLTLKLETAPAGGGAPPLPTPMPGVPGGMNPIFQQQTNASPGGQNIPMPGSFNPATARPMIHIRRPLIHVPGRVPTPGGEAQQQPPPPPAGQPTPPPAPAR